MKIAGTIYTIGHSNTSFDEFKVKLDAHNIELLIDVRSHPGSRTVQWTNKDALMNKLGTKYLWVSELGGPTDGPYSDPLNFPKHHIGKVRPDFVKIPKEQRPHTWWNQGLFDVDVWMGTDRRFLDGLAKLEELASKQRIAIMCSELLWWKCHRSMIADVWCALGGEALHIMNTKLSSVHSKINLIDRLSRYSDNTQKLWSGITK